MVIKGIKKENVSIEIDTYELNRLLMSYMKLEPGEWIGKNKNGKWVVFYNGDELRFRECEKMELTDQDLEYFESAKRVIKYITEKEKKRNDD